MVRQAHQPLRRLKPGETGARGILPPSIQKKEIVDANYKGEVIKHDVAKYVPETEYVVKVLEVAGDITANTVFPNSRKPKATRLNESCWRSLTT